MFQNNGYNLAGSPEIGVKFVIVNIARLQKCVLSKNSPNNAF